jgi:DNA-binding NtrC family response regulator
MSARILVIDDEEEMLENYRRLLSARGWECQTFPDARRALEWLDKESCDLIITDLRMPDFDGVDVVKQARSRDPSALVIMVTAYASVESAVAAVKAGAYDYLAKPFTADQLALLVERALQERRLRRENVMLKRQLGWEQMARPMIGEGAAMKQLRVQIERAASSDASVFIVGESGTGKELVAHALHAGSHRADQPIVPVDCVALPRELIEGELFGHEKGAFTSATTAKAGLFECATGGTLFLDEICELDFDMQAKLLRVLQERQIRRLGGRQLIPLDLRIIAATNRDPKVAVEEGRLREDLLYRLDVVRITVPPLRERRDDIRLLLEFFLDRFRTAGAESVEHFAADALESLAAYDWPGNVRELRNLVERTVLMSGGQVVTRADLPAQISAPADIPAMQSPEDALDYKSARKNWVGEFEKRYFKKLLERYDGNISKAAEEAGIDRKTLYRILREYGPL